MFSALALALALGADPTPVIDEKAEAELSEEIRAEERGLDLEHLDPPQAIER